ncbi:Protein hunchback [Orchesella cincta]|uniref:Protein hunchback n=1 Tax=Orchesella cincta TaxID=48709 RepID=A0A1D2N8F1_ORCCI|nr:Protein hunchback [Orchesella cincta]
MLVERSRSVGALAPSATSPVARHHLPADLSPRSSNSSLLSSNESLLNTSLSVPSPAKESGNSPGGFSALQRLQYALESNTLFSTYFHETDNEHLEQQISKTYPNLSPNGSLINSSNTRDDSDETAEEIQEDHLDEHHAPSPRNGSEMGVVSSPTGSPNSTGNGNLANTIFQCPLCAVVCSSRHDFNEHLVTHSQQHACPKCDFITNTEEALRDHVHEAHGADDVVDMLSDDEMKTPKTNAQGKLKTFKCKHCEHRAVTKKEFWDHTKSHIRQEKMLHCPKCPFVTEYKHHLEYHLRNHFNSKPYQCNKCSYSCVNKSMLNSHLKSHSNVYQYRCSDCSYATKYCHSLKLHLRKYNHNPAMVLNPDGTPNPLPIIDVYGTRRGPKIKRTDPNLEGMATTPVASSPTKPKAQRKPSSTPIKKEKTEKQRQLDARDLSPKLASSPRCVSSMPNQSITPPLKRMRTESGDSESDMRISSHPLMQNTKVPQLPQAPISPSSIALILQQNGLDGRKEMAAFPHPSPNPLEFYNAALNQYLLNPMFHMAATSPLNELAQQMANDQQTKLLAQLLQSRMMQPQQMQQQQLNINMANDLRANKHANLAMNGGALDLSKNEDSAMHDDLKKRKRKGKALRYERRFSDDEDEEEALDFSNNNNNAFQVNRERKGYDGPTDLSVPNYMCKYCEITFPDRELFAMHMNFHSGDMDPFLCRSCGKKSKDKIAFYKHVATDPH